MQLYLMRLMIHGSSIPEKIAWDVPFPGHLRRSGRLSVDCEADGEEAGCGEAKSFNKGFLRRHSIPLGQPMELSHRFSPPRFARSKRIVN